MCGLLAPGRERALVNGETGKLHGCRAAASRRSRSLPQFDQALPAGAPNRDAMLVEDAQRSSTSSPMDKKTLTSRSVICADPRGHQSHRRRGSAQQGGAAFPEEDLDVLRVLALNRPPSTRCAARGSSSRNGSPPSAPWPARSSRPQESRPSSKASPTC